MGLYVEGPAFRQFSVNTYVGGNFVPAASKDVGLTGLSPQSGFDPTDVDEMKAMYISDTACTPTPGLRLPEILGHGTHTAALLAANGATGLNVQGTCKRCGLAAFKAAYLECVVSTGQVIPRLNTNASNRGKPETVDTGVQVLSMSLGVPNTPSNFTNCKAALYQREARCLAVDYAVSRDVAQVASSGNKKQELDFPASDRRMISAGGFQPTLAFWDESPSGITNCPLTPNAEGCGSNFSKLDGSAYPTRQELLGSAKHVLSTTYPNTTWVDYAECGDGYGTPVGDGVGWCTGTSMSAPQVAGVVGLLRSISPLVPTGSPEPVAGEKPGLRTVLKQTASRVGAWDPKLGYGVPDDAARVAFLFALYQKLTGSLAAEQESPRRRKRVARSIAELQLPSCRAR